MYKSLTYSVPYKLLASYLSGPVVSNSRADVLSIYRAFAARMNPPPAVHGVECLPADGRLVLAANHYQRKGLWIAHIASVLSNVMAGRYGCDPPIRWVATGNWPRWKIGPLTVRSPGDILLPRVAHAVWCYPVPFAGTNPGTTARSLRRLLKDAAALECPIGIFPEGAKATAGRLTPPLPGVGRLFRLLAERGWPVVPAGVSEAGRFVVRFGAPIPAHEVKLAADPGALVMSRIAELCRPAAL
jgi:1-acyl-sn-glycerol-3-phosphate acyltransferase